MSRPAATGLVTGKQATAPADASGWAGVLAGIPSLPVSGAAPRR